MAPLRSLPGRPAYPFIENTQPQPLEMVRPRSAGHAVVSSVPAGYLLRQFRPGDERRYDELFHLAFADEGRFDEIRGRALAGGFFVVEDLASNHLVASCVAFSGSSSPRHHAGQLGWLLTDPSHAGKRLGTIVAASVTNRFIDEGYERPFLGTEDFRLAAIAVYLNLGWCPFLYREEMRPRWQRIFRALGRDFVTSG